MAEDRANNPARQPDLRYKGLEGIEPGTIASVSRPSSGYAGSGGRINVQQYTEEELGPREMTKFDPKNKYHVGLLTAKDDSNKGMMLHSGGYFSFPKKGAPSKTEGKAKPQKAVAAAEQPIAGTRSGAKAREAALAANEAKMSAARKRLAEQKKK